VKVKEIASNRLLSLREAAQKTGYTEAHIYRMIQEEVLPAVREYQGRKCNYWVRERFLLEICNDRRETHGRRYWRID